MVRWSIRVGLPLCARSGTNVTEEELAVPKSFR